MNITRIKQYENEISEFAYKVNDESTDIHELVKLHGYATDSLEKLGNETIAGMYNQHVFWQYFYMFLNTFEVYTKVVSKS